MLDLTSDIKELVDNGKRFIEQSDSYLRDTDAYNYVVNGW